MVVLYGNKQERAGCQNSSGPFYTIRHRACISYDGPLIPSLYVLKFTVNFDNLLMTVHMYTVSTISLYEAYVAFSSLSVQALKG